MTPFALAKNQLLSEYATSAEGLSSAEAKERFYKNGENKLDKGKKKSLASRIWAEMKNPMILVLIGAAVLSGLFKEFSDMFIILIVVVLNTVLGIFQESKAEKAIEALQNLSAPHSRVKRDGQIKTIPSHELVLGDLVLLEAGDSVPADLRLLETHSLKTEEAALTGESVPAEKDAEDLLESDIPLGDRTNMVFMGTNVVYGRGEGIVVGTGMQTEMGKIAGILSGTEEEKTPLQKKLAALSKTLSIAVIGICVFIFAFSVFRGGEVFPSLLTAVSLAVAAIPEGLVVVVTILLSIGVTKMASRGTIIRKLTAVETLGCTQVICSDKTGTLTQNKMTVTAHYGDEPLLSLALGLCNDAKQDETGALLGDPTETALLLFAQKCGHTALPERYPRTDELPFDSERKMMSTFHAQNQKVLQYTKGAPDEILKRSAYFYQNGKIVPMTESLREEILEKNKEMADRALRVLAAAFREYDRLPEDITANCAETDLVFIGLAGMIDPIRPEVKTAIEDCQSAGIRPIMITGDHKDTAVAIAKDLGILTDASQAITGAELALLSDEEFENNITRYSVYARVQPEHKVRIVKAWKKKGKITAMTGDGVNDAPALKTADIGVGMGITGTDVTKNVSDMVLSDDNFTSIVFAVEEGRRIYENIRKAVQFLLASNLSEVFSIFVATLAGVQLFAPIHILWINLITDTFPAMALGMEEQETDTMKKPPRKPEESIFSDGLGVQVLWQGCVIGILTLAAFFVGNASSHATGMTMAFLTLSMCEIFHSFNMRSRSRSIFSLKGQNKYLFGAMLLSFVLTLGVIFVPGVNDVFQLVSLDFMHFISSVAIALLVLPIVELAKYLRKKA